MEHRACTSWNYFCAPPVRRCRKQIKTSGSTLALQPSQGIKPWSKGTLRHVSLPETQHQRHSFSNLLVLRDANKTSRGTATQVPVSFAKAASAEMQKAKMPLNEEVPPTTLASPERDKVICDLGCRPTADGRHCNKWTQQKLVERRFYQCWICQKRK